MCTQVVKGQILKDRISNVVPELSSISLLNRRLKKGRGSYVNASATSMYDSITIYEVRPAPKLLQYLAFCALGNANKKGSFSHDKCVFGDECV